MRLIDAEEAYKVLTDYYHHKTEIQHKALKEAIERVPTADIDAITESHERTGYDRGFRDGYAEALEATDNAEPVRHGHWTDNGHIGRRRWCSECGGIAFEQYDDYGLAEVTESDYCPHCGAKMDEVETK